MGKNRNRIVNRSALANGVAAATVVKTEQADHLASAVSWACKAEFGPALAWLTCGYYLTQYVKGALVKEKARTGGGGNLSATRATAKKIAVGEMLKATGNDGPSLPDVDELINAYNAYALLSGHMEEPSTTTCEAPWSGFRILAPLATRSQPETEGWTFCPAVDVAKAKTIYQEWLSTRPRITVKALEGSVRDLLGLAPKAKPEKKQDAPASPVQDSGEKPATAIIPGATVAPNATVNPPAPSEGAEGATAADNPAAPSVAAQEALPSPTEVEGANPNFAPGGEGSTGETTPVETATGDVAEEAPPTPTPDTTDTKSDLPKPGRKDPEESDPTKHKSAATIARDALLATRQDDIHASFYDLGQMILAEKKGQVYLTALIQGVIDRVTDEDAEDTWTQTVVEMFNLLDHFMKVPV